MKALSLILTLLFLSEATVEGTSLTGRDLGSLPGDNIYGYIKEETSPTGAYGIDAYESVVKTAKDAPGNYTEAEGIAPED